MRELEITSLASVRSGRIDSVGEQRLLEAIIAAGEQGEVTLLLQHGKMLAAIVPADHIQGGSHD